MQSGVISKGAPKTPRPHQQEAINSALAHLKAPDTRGKLLMACGTGKTLVGLRVAEGIAGPGGTGVGAGAQPGAALPNPAGLAG